MSGSAMESVARATPPKIARQISGLSDRTIAWVFVAPTIFDNVQDDMSIATDEIFGPVLSVVRASDYEEALKLVDEVVDTNVVGVPDERWGQAITAVVELREGAGHRLLIMNFFFVGNRLEFRRRSL